MPFELHPRSKTWLIDANVSAGAGAKTAIRTFKDRLKLLTSHWELKGSCDSVAAGMDGVDRWDSDSDLVYSATEGNPRSWLVMKQKITGAQFMLWCNDSDEGRPQRYFSPAAGFTGGSTTARPTATDEVTYPHATEFWGTNRMIHVGSSNRLHILQSTDGKNTHAFWTTSDTKHYVGALWIGEALRPTPGWSHPYYFYSYGNRGGPFFGSDAKQMFDNDHFHVYDAKLGAIQNATLVVEQQLTTEATLYDWVSRRGINEIASRYEIQPIGIASNVESSGTPSSNFHTLWGWIPDVYISYDPEGAIPAIPGDTTAIEPNRRWVSVGSGVVVPWTGSPMTVS